MSTPTLDQLKRALKISEQIEGLKAELDAIFSGNGKVSASVKGPAVKAQAVKSGKTKRTMSPEARAKISAAAKKRWAGVKAKVTTTPTTASQSKSAAKALGANRKTKRIISPESRAKMAAAAKKRWAGVKKAAK